MGSCSALEGFCKACIALFRGLQAFANPETKQHNAKQECLELDLEPRLADLGDVTLAYHDWGAGPAVLLIHGFASNARMNWVSTDWAQTLLKAGYRVVALDNRGHGESTKFYSPDDYGPDIFAYDAKRLLDHLEIRSCHVIGYSMGARITAWLCHAYPALIDRAVLGGMGHHIFGNRGGHEEVAHGLETDKPEEITNRMALAFRKFADNTRSDRHALAACIRPSRQKITEDIMRSIETTTLIAVGDKDEIAGSPHKLAAIMKNAEGFVIEGLDHMKATGAQPFKDRTVKFLAINGVR